MEEFQAWKDEHNTRFSRFQAFLKGEKQHVTGNDIGRIYEVFNICNY